jgi:aminopeptidase N
MQISHRFSLILIASAVTGTPAFAASFSVADAPGRLPKNVVPVSYSISVEPDATAMTINGQESIVLEVRAVTNTIQFNSLNETLRDVRLDGKPALKVVSDDESQLTTVSLRSAAAVGTHRLSFSYSGKIETEPHGLFVQPYSSPNGEQRVLLSTQMEATDARRLFPCWDEPAFRAKFRMSATLPADWAVVSNMPIVKRVAAGKLATTTFGTTPRMPSYLMELTAGEIAAISAKKDGVNFGVWAVKGLESNGAIALVDVQTILSDYNDYFGYKYPLPKLDSIAIPGGFTGAMENWGAITYNDQLLLLSSSSSIKDRQQAYSVQAHEMAHQWNGDLVTMAWWDDIWLNESFASWMAAKETDRRHPDWKWWEGQDADKEDAMGADARATSHSIQQHVTNELQATNSFDPQITYSKGQAILRMFEAYLGPDVFRDGIRRYMQEFAFSNATTHNLWDALSAAGNQDIGAIVAGWTEQPGFPLVSVAASCDAAGARTIALSQKRFLLQGKENEHAAWKIPLQIRLGVDTASRAVLLTQDQKSAPAGRCEEPLSVNAGALGFYRTHYDSATLATDTKNFGRLPDSDRIALLDDQWALVRSGVDALPTFLALAGSMGADLDTRAWRVIAGAMASIEYDERGSGGHDAFAAYARTVLRPPFEKLGWTAQPDETPDVQELRQSLIRQLGNLGDQGIIEEARKRFAAFLQDHNSLPPDYQDSVLTIVARSADAATFEQLHSLASTAKDETEFRRYYSALMAVRDPALAKQAAQIALSPQIPPQADALRFQLIARLSGEHQELSWQVFRDNNEALLKPFAANGPMIVSQYLPEAYWSGIPPAEIEEWVRAHVPAEMGPNVERGMETVRFRLAEKERLVRAADAFDHT